MKKLLVILLIIVVLAIGIVWLISSKSTVEQNILPTTSEISQTTIMAENLDTPWGMVFLPNGGILVTERPGRLRLIENNQLQPEPVATLEKVKEIGEGGLLGITLNPQFSTNNYLYLYYAYSSSGNNTFNRVVRMAYQDN